MTVGFLARWSRLKRKAAPAESIAPVGEGSGVACLVHAAVSEALARAALRRTWISEPSIRNFIGIAESQWDFNGSKMAGFGPLPPDAVQGGAGAADLARPNQPALETFTSLPTLPCPPNPATTQGTDQEPCWQVPGQAMPARNARGQLSASATIGAPRQRPHGGALPADG